MYPSGSCIVLDITSWNASEDEVEHRIMPQMLQLYPTLPLQHQGKSYVARQRNQHDIKKLRGKTPGLHCSLSVCASLSKQRGSMIIKVIPTS